MSFVEDKANDGATNTFPAGLRVLAIDDDPTCLMLLERMLQACHYQVTKCQRANEALSLLREGKDRFDIVICDVHMPDMDGFRLLEIIGVEMDLPVVMMSNDDTKDVIMRVIIQGACDYLVKPVRLEEVRLIWQHVVRKQRNNLKALASPNKGDDGEVHQNKPNGNATFGDKEIYGSSNREKDEEEEGFKDDIISLKKPRMVWTTELHEQFVVVVNQIGLKNAVPKKILELMNVPGLTRENVASHLQKYRLYLRRKNENSQNKFGMTPLQLQDLNIQYHSSLDNSKIQAYTISNHLQPPCSISKFDPKIGASNDLLDLGSYYNYGMTESMLGAEQQSCAIGRQVNVAHEAPAMIESAQDCSMLMQRMQNSYYPLTLPSTIIHDANGLVTEYFGLELPHESISSKPFSINKNSEYASSLSYESMVFTGHFDQDDPTSRLYFENYGGQFEEKF